MNVWKNLSCHYDGSPIFKNLEFSWEEGEEIGFWGCSGCGKTSLLKLIAKRLCKEGKRIAYVFQNEVLFDWMTVEENIFLVNVRPFVEDYETVMEILKLKEHQKKYPQELSGGLRKRVALARALLFPAEYLLLDEAFEFLDLALQEKILSFLEEQQKKKRRTIFVVTHRVEIILRLTQKVFFFEKKGAIQKLELYDIKNKEEAKRKLEEEVCHI